MKRRQAIKIRKRIFQDDDPITSKDVIDQYKRTTDEESWRVFDKLSREKKRYLYAKWMNLNLL